MTALLMQFLPYIIAVIGGALGLFAYGAKKKRDGKREARAEQSAAEAAARDVADQVDNDVGALPGSKAREELGKWSAR